MSKLRSEGYTRIQSNVTQVRESCKGPSKCVTTHSIYQLFILGHGFPYVAFIWPQNSLKCLYWFGEYILFDKYSEITVKKLRCHLQSGVLNT
jgi:hypothetical protein